MSVSLTPDLSPAGARFAAQLNRGNPGAGAGKSAAEFAQALTAIIRVADPVTAAIPNPVPAPTAPVLPDAEPDAEAAIDSDAEQLPGRPDPQELTWPQPEFWQADVAAAIVAILPGTKFGPITASPENQTDHQPDIRSAQAHERGDQTIGQTIGRATDPSAEIPVWPVPGNVPGNVAVWRQSLSPIAPTRLPPIPFSIAPHHPQSPPISVAIPPHGQPPALSSPAPPQQANPPTNPVTNPLTNMDQLGPTLPARATDGTVLLQAPSGRGPGFAGLPPAPASLSPRPLHRPQSMTAASGPSTMVSPYQTSPNTVTPTSPPITQTATAPPPRTGVDSVTDTPAKLAQTLGQNQQTGSRPDGFTTPQHMLISALPALPQAAPDGRAMAAHIATQLAQAGRAQPSGSTDIVLNPRELGQVRLNLQALDGAISVTIIAERPETADLMRRHMDMLTQEFRSLGYQDITISFGGRQGSRDDGPAQQFQSGSRQDDPDRDSKSGPAASQTPDPTTDSDLPRPAATRTGRGGLDLRL